MKPIYIKLIAALVLIGSLIAVYFIFGDIVFNQTHNIDQEVEHSMDGITAIKIKKMSIQILLYTQQITKIFMQHSKVKLALHQKTQSLFSKHLKKMRF